MPSSAELFALHLRSVFGQEDSIHSAAAPDGGPPVGVFVYRDIPERGMITGVTYGLSQFPLPDWRFGRPEMIVSVQSDSIDWPCAAATFAALDRGRRPFEFGDLFLTSVPLAADTQMSGFFVFAQSLLDPDEASLKLPDYKINFVQFYPIYASEVPIYERLGLAAFWHHPGFHPWDVRRPAIRD